MSTRVNLFGVASASLGLVSSVAATYIVVSACRFSYGLSHVRNATLNRTIFLVNLIKWMSCCDIVFGLITGTQYLSVASESTFRDFNGKLPTGWCVFKAFVLQFCSVASVSWNFIIGFTLLCHLYYRMDLEQIALYNKYYHIFVWYSASFGAIIPLSFNALGYVTNSDGNKFECWINVDIYQMCAYGPIGLYLIFAILLLCYCVYLRFGRQQQMINLTERLIYFTIVFVAVWIFPFIDRIYNIFFGDDEKHKWLAYLHDLGFASVGLLNALVWGTSGLWSQYYQMLRIHPRNSGIKNGNISNNNSNVTENNNVINDMRNDDHEAYVIVHTDVENNNDHDDIEDRDKIEPEMETDAVTQTAVARSNKTDANTYTPNTAMLATPLISETDAANKPVHMSIDKGKHDQKNEQRL